MVEWQYKKNGIPIKNKVMPCHLPHVFLRVEQYYTIYFEIKIINQSTQIITKNVNNSTPKLTTC
jgi:hypothetical protein